MPLQYVKDVKVAKTKVNEKNVVFSDEVKRQTTQRIKFHLKQMASLIQNVGEASAEEEYQEVKKELVEVVIDKTVDLMKKDIRLDIKEVPPIKLEREIPYVIPETDDRDGIISFDDEGKTIPLNELKVSAYDYLTQNMKKEDLKGLLKIFGIPEDTIEEELEKLMYKQRNKVNNNDKNNVSPSKKEISKTKDLEFEKRSTASKKGWETRRKNKK